MTGRSRMAAGQIGDTPVAHDVEATTAEFAADVRRALAGHPRRQLSSRYFYDPLGSALFDAICRLPWYRITRAETGLLTRYGAEILAALEPLGRVIELGAGSGEKLAVLLSARPPGAARLPVHLVDVSRAALNSAARTLGALGNVEVVAHQSRFLTWLETAGRPRRAEPAPGGRALAMFLGSNIGNFEPPAADALLARIRAMLQPGDAFLLGADLVKPEHDLRLAYDDPLGVTAAFNRNLLVRINRELGGEIDVGSFRHHVVWNREASRIEMYLVSTRAQRVRIAAADVDVSLEEGDAIWTESSHKYEAGDVVRMLERCGFARRAQWLDGQAGFALTLVGVTV
ncbi:MAG TPA: L-histidine N(alpha)-methyltransferase [Vicinamibacterales bacterium]|nr:L-histidine N(alpha)-methyltransferase [Vicinamibacterales bacterium]